MENYLTEEDYRYIYSRVPRLCVDLLIKNNDGVLLALRSKSPYKGMWNTMGGTVYKGETLIEACKRIAKNEAGIEVNIVKSLGYVECLNEERGIHSVSTYFEADIIGGELKPDDNTEELRFFKELPENLIKEQKEFLLSRI